MTSELYSYLVELSSHCTIIFISLSLPLPTMSLLLFVLTRVYPKLWPRVRSFQAPINYAFLIYVIHTIQNWLISKQLLFDEIPEELSHLAVKKKLKSQSMHKMAIWNWFVFSFINYANDVFIKSIFKFLKQNFHIQSQYSLSCCWLVRSN